jgi:hypothetical protein
MKINKKEKTIIVILISVILTLSIFLAMYSVFLYMNAFHNIDTARNISIVNSHVNQLGLNFIDKNSADVLWTSSDMYTYGLDGLKQAFTIFGFSVFLIGLCIGLIIKFEFSGK